MGRDVTLEEAIAQLGAKHSPKRRAAAKLLRKRKDPAAGPALLAALTREVREPRTWETQYHLVMALGESHYQPALPTLWALARANFEATMVYVALGDAIVRLGRREAEDPTPVLDILATGNDMLCDGAFRAVAMLRLRLTPEAVERTVDHVAARNGNDGLRFWVAAAAAGWDGPKVRAFLSECAEGPREDVAKAARAALQKQYLRWQPL